MATLSGLYQLGWTLGADPWWPSEVALITTFHGLGAGSAASSRLPHIRSTDVNLGRRLVTSACDRSTVLFKTTIDAAPSSASAQTDARAAPPAPRTTAGRA